MKHLILSFILLAITKLNFAQQFITKGSIEFEVTTNIKKTMSTNSWTEMLQENMSDFKIAYYNFNFADNKSIYFFDRWSDKTKIPKWYKENDEENKWYFDYANNKQNIQKQIQGNLFVIEDTVSKIKWRLTNESREIAGFNCRKAIGVIMDSVYVFAFYTDDITITGGPCSINGLPGMILGLSIPRLYTSFIATKVNLSASSYLNSIKPNTAKKLYTNKSFTSFIKERTEGWFDWGDDKVENNRLKNLFYWNSFL
jgi:GLPGLI family protein